MEVSQRSSLAKGPRKDEIKQVMNTDIFTDFISKSMKLSVIGEWNGARGSYLNAPRLDLTLPPVKSDGCG